MGVSRSLIKAIFIVLVCATGITASAGQRTAPAGRNDIAVSQERPRRATTTVKVYLWRFNPKDVSNSWQLVSVERNVSRITPARGAIDGLLAGPTLEEKSAGIQSPDTAGVKIEHLIINNGLADLNLVSDCPKCPRWSGSGAPVRFKEAFEMTLKQFRTVKRVRIEFNGRPDVDSW